MKHVWWLKYIFLWKANGGWERRQKATGSITWWGKEETRSKKEKRRRTTGAYFLYSWHINVSIWATACLLLPQPNINLLLVDCSCVRGRYTVAQSLTLIQVESDEQGIGSSWGIVIDHFYFLWKCFWQNNQQWILLGSSGWLISISVCVYFYHWSRMFLFNWFGRDELSSLMSSLCVTWCVSNSYWQIVKNNSKIKQQTLFHISFIQTGFLQTFCLARMILISWNR